MLVHTPVHASWLNQAEIYHSIIQRKLLDPNDFETTAELARALNDFERHYNQIAEPFEWNFTRDKLPGSAVRGHVEAAGLAVGVEDSGLCAACACVPTRAGREPGRPCQVGCRVVIRGGGWMPVAA
jgi:hypothetical protein